MTLLCVPKLHHMQNNVIVEQKNFFAVFVCLEKEAIFAYLFFLHNCVV